jgi:NAD(P)-dependent dehydrogenase (short-subunit alcohol dehydrogenase family)
LGLGAAAASATAIEPAFADGAVTLKAIMDEVAKAPKRQVLITGCDTSAASLAAAKLLAFSGHEVICTAKSIAGGRTAFRYVEDNIDRANKKEILRKGGSGEYTVLDSSSRLSITDVSSILKGSKLDSVILNDPMTSSSLEITEEGFEKTVANNYLGPLYFMNKLANIMPAYAKPQARVVLNVSPEHKDGSLGSMAGLAAGKFEMIDGGSFNSAQAFKDSQLASMMLMGEAAKQFAGKVNVNAVYTDYKEFSTDNFPLEGGYRGYSGTVPKEAEFAGAVLAYMAVDPALDSTTGKWFVAKTGAKTVEEGTPSTAASDPEMQKKLWDLAVAATAAQGRFVSPLGA